MTVHSCSKAIECMAACTDGYTLGATGSDGCPSCTCNQPSCTSGCTETHHQVIAVGQPSHSGSSSSGGSALVTSGGSRGTPFSSGGSGSGGGMTGGGKYISKDFFS